MATQEECIKNLLNISKYTLYSNDNNVLIDSLHP